MTHIPEDSMLRRHYLTELKSKQDILLQKFIDHTEITKPNDTSVYAPPPLWSNNVLIPLIGFLFFLAILFL